MTFRIRCIAALSLTLVASACQQGDPGGLSLAVTGDSQDPDPVVQDFPLVFISRPFIINDQGDVASNTPRQLNVFEPGAQLILKEQAIPSALERNISDAAFTDDTSGTAPLYDVRDLETDYDGRRLAFSMRGPFDPDADLEDQPTWNIWVYDLDTDQLSRVIQSDTLAEAGQDRDPAFLPDGRIVFTSTRQRQSRAILLDEGRPQFAALDEDRREEASVLHVMNNDGTGIEQLTFNQSHDQGPNLLNTGEIIFSRWDNVPGRNFISLYRIRPDGTQLERLYGYHSQDTGRDGSDIAFMDPRQMDDDQILVIARSNSNSILGGDLMIIDSNNFVEHDQTIFDFQGSSAEGQTSPLSTLVELDGPSPGGRFASAVPLLDGTNRLLVSWSQCRLLERTLDSTAPNGGEIVNIVPCTDELLSVSDPAPEEADPLYGLWILNLDDDSQQSVVPPLEGVVFSEAVVMSPRPNPDFLQPQSADNATQLLIDEAAGLLHIRSVYDFDGIDIAQPDLSTIANPVLTTSSERTAHFLRMEKPVSLPDRDLVVIPGSAFGRSRGELMREIIGYATVHPDGSVYVKVPADVPFAISVLDANGRRITGRHRNWLQVRPGELLECNGCHTSNSEIPHGRRDAQAPSINPGGPYPDLDPAFAATASASMAEAFAGQNGAPDPAFDLVFDDLWTDPVQRGKDAAFSYRYSDLQSPAPINASCTTNWISSCRATIHYEANIHPVWQVDRRIFDVDGTTLLVDQTCTTCHTMTDDMGMARVPEGQLDLTDGPSSDEPDHFKSYRELLFGDSEQEVVNGVLVDVLVPVLDSNGNPTFLTDANGDLVLDALGNPIPILTTVGVRPAMATAGALASPVFTSAFDSTGTHSGYLSAAELKLISEWLDIGAQYYNDPFKVPQQ